MASRHAGPLRLGRILAELVPNEAEVHGLVALMELQASASVRRRFARTFSRLGCDEARAELERAAELTKHDRERALLLKRAVATH